MCDIKSSCIGQPKSTTCLGWTLKRTLDDSGPSRIASLPDDRARIVEVAQRAVREKADFEVDYRIALPGGSIKRVHSVGHPVVNNAGDVIELVGTHVDITEQYRSKGKVTKSF